MLSKTGPQYQASSGDSIAETRQNTDTAGSGMIVLPDEGLQSPAPPAHVINTEPLQPKERSPQGYYGQHTLFQLFDEVRFCALVIPAHDSRSFDILDPTTIPFHPRNS